MTFTHVYLVSSHFVEHSMDGALKQSSSKLCLCMLRAAFSVWHMVDTHAQVLAFQIATAYNLDEFVSKRIITRKIYINE